MNNVQFTHVLQNNKNSKNSGESANPGGRFFAQKTA